MIAVQIVATIVALWIFGNGAGWFITVGRLGHPLNWRIIAGPVVYMNWLYRRNPDWWRKS